MTGIGGFIFTKKGMDAALNIIPIEQRPIGHVTMFFVGIFGVNNNWLQNIDL